MIEISKQELIPLIANHYRQLLQESTYHIYAFQQKYGCSLADFENRIKTEEENFERWDDYISWKGHTASAQDLLTRIQQIEDGLFEIA